MPELFSGVLQVRLRHPHPESLESSESAMSVIVTFGPPPPPRELPLRVRESRVTAC